jgi:hypothetical protein
VASPHSWQWAVEQIQARHVHVAFDTAAHIHQEIAALAQVV